MPITVKKSKPEMPTKNKWLYPTDEFGEMEKGVVYDTKIFANTVVENKDNTDLIILQKRNYASKRKSHK